jgi:hypothetical protein
MRRFRYCFLLLIFIFVSAHDYPAPDFLWPVDRPMKLSGSFCEYRGIKFHHGIDIGCGGRKGYRIFASDDGYVSSVMYQKLGIGYAVMLRHKNGLTTLYGHMDSFERSILENGRLGVYQRNILDRKDFRIDYEKPEILFRRGDVIGYSGDSGIGIEHLHFEIRDANDVMLNPLKNGIKIADKSPPVIERLYLVPLDNHSHINGASNAAVYDVKPASAGKDGYVLEDDSCPTVGGRVGLKVSAYDTTGNINHVGIYRIDFLIDGKSIYRIVFDRISREQTHGMGLFYDYDHSSMSKYTYFLYSKASDAGVINAVEDGKTHRLSIICHDASGNRSSLELDMKTAMPLVIPAFIYEPNLFPDKPSELSSGDGNFRINFEKNSAYYVEMMKVGEPGTIDVNRNGLTVKSASYMVTPTNLCIGKPAQITFSYRGDDFAKVGIYSAGNNGSYGFVSGQYDEKRKCYSAGVYKMGRFFLMRDDIPPRISFRNNKKKIKPEQPICIYAADRGCGIDLRSVYLKVDGRDVIWDYDYDKRYIEILRHNEIWGKGKHVIDVRVSDWAGNNSDLMTYSYEI